MKLHFDLIKTIKMLSSDVWDINLIFILVSHMAGMIYCE
jgi:hypothetical protein